MCILVIANLDLSKSRPSLAGQTPARLGFKTVVDTSGVLAPGLLGPISLVNDFRRVHDESQAAIVERTDALGHGFNVPAAQDVVEYGRQDYGRGLADRVVGPSLCIDVPGVLESESQRTGASRSGDTNGAGGPGWG